MFCAYYSEDRPEMIDSLNSILNYFFDLLGQVANLYLLVPILAIPVALFVFKKVVNFFRHVLP